MADAVKEGETGLLVPSGDIEALTRAMATLINQPELRERLGNAAKKRSTLFTASVAVPEFERFYRRVIGQSTDHNQREIDIDVLGHA